MTLHPGYSWLLLDGAARRSGSLPSFVRDMDHGAGAFPVVGTCAGIGV